MNKPTSLPPLAAKIEWKSIDTVLLDMDGTLLDKYFDDYFWEEYVPEQYGLKHQLNREDAIEALLAKYRSVENTLQWTDLHYWSERLGLNIPQMKKDIDHLVGVHDHVIDFLGYMKNLGKKLCLVTNAHPKALEIKLAKADIGPFFDTIICSEEVGEAKEKVDFWYRLENMLSFDNERTLFADDTEKVLRSAREYGIHHLVHIAKPSSRLEIKYSEEFPSIVDFSELMDE